MDEWLSLGEEDELAATMRSTRAPLPDPAKEGDWSCPATIERIAHDPPGAARLARIASLLRACPHPGLVELVDHSPGRLTLRRVEGPDLAQARRFQSEEVAAVGAALATTLADLHDLGIAHRAIRPEHVLLDPAGRPILCGLGEAQRRAPDDPAHRRAARVDARALALLLQQLAGPRAGTLSRVLARAVGTRGRAVGCRRLAQQLARATRSPRLPEDPWPRPGWDEPSPDTAPTAQLNRVDPGGEPAPRPWRRPWTRRCHHPHRPWAGGHRRWAGGLLVASVALVVVASSVVAASWPAVRHQGSAASTPVSAARRRATACPTSDRSCGPLRHAGTDINVDGRQFSLGQPGDIVVLGRWHCRGPATPALLHPGTGEVWLFPRWAGTDRPVPGRLLVRVPGATSLRVRPGSAGCDALVVLRRHTRSVLVRPRSHP